jgi:hypothetical protein
VKALFEQAAEAQSKKLTCRAEPISVWGDALKLKQVLTNLVVNALKYSPPGGEIGIAVRYSRPTESVGPTARRKAEIVLTDSGPGIALEFRERIFERGFRLKEHDHLPGKGLGLSIVREIVAQHGGTVRATGQPGEGATFVVSLPCDMRVREREPRMLLLPESDAVAVLIEAIRKADPRELTALMADRSKEFLDLAAACGAFVVVPRNQASALSQALAGILTTFPEASPP